MGSLVNSENSSPRFPEGLAQGLKWTPLVRTPFQLAVHRSHPFAPRQRVTPAEVARESLLACFQRNYPEYRDMLTGWLRRHRQRPTIASEYDGVNSLMEAVESGLGMAIVATRKGLLGPERVRLKALAPAPPPLCIAAGCRADQADDKALVVFVEDLRRAAQAFA